MYARACFVAVGLGLLAVTASQGACSKPEAPGCAFERTPFTPETKFDECRMEMLKFRDAMDSYASCLGETSADQEKAARDEYESVRIRFNQRARGEFDQPPYHHGADPATLVRIGNDNSQLGLSEPPGLHDPSYGNDTVSWRLRNERHFPLIIDEAHSGQAFVADPIL